MYTTSALLVDSFAALAGPGIPDENIDLIRAALNIARTEYPALDIEAYVTRVDELAGRAGDVTLHGSSQDVVSALNRVLFEEAGLRGNRENYYDPRNSFLNDVLDRRLGIPITLAVVYMEVARRVGFPMVGVGMPG